MRSPLPNPLLCGIALLAIAAVAAVAWQLAEARGALRSATLALGRKQREWRRLAALTPAPTEQQAAAITADLARAEGDLAVLTAAAGDRDATAEMLAAAAKAPCSRAEAFFDLAEFVRRQHELAGSAGVAVAAEEQFGFSAYGHCGPETELIAPVVRQRQIAGFLLECLFASHIKQLIAVQRAPPLQARADAALGADSDARARADLFEIDSRFSVRDPGVVETTAFRLTFVGHTAALRGFLNRLARGGIPVIVRAVEVAPGRETPVSRPAAGGADPLQAIVRPTWSRFAVTLEFCDLTSVAEEAASRAGPPLPADAGHAPRNWPEPSPQRRGSNWVFDVFTPPALYYERRAGRMSALAAADAAPPDPAEPEIDLQLVDVRRGPFRLQLVGYAGEPENLRGIFVEPGTGETRILRGGERLPAQGLRVKRIDLSRGTAGPKDDAFVDVAAQAIVQDETTGADVTLSSREACLAGAPLGVFTSHKTPGFRREMREGESVALNGCDYCITHIDLQPPQIVIACLTPGTAEPRFRTLAPVRVPPSAERPYPVSAPEKNGNPPARTP